MLLTTVAFLLQAQVADPPADTATRRSIRRRPVTAALASNAFADDPTRALFQLARRARTAQDSALRGYVAKTSSRLSVGLGTGALMRNRLLYRNETVARVRWQRGKGMWIEPLAQRNTTPGGAVSITGIEDQLVPLPYYPGRETLWIPGSTVVKEEVNENNGFAHPLATGSEAYYRYALGDSIRFALPNGERITLREMRVTARKPEWRSFVGSFWFDAGSGQLVRAAYRLAAPFEVWNFVNEEVKRELAEAARDTSKNRDARLKSIKEDSPPGWVTQLTNPLRVDLTLVTTEYALMEGRFWLPRVNRAEGYAQAAFVKMPITVQESYKYEEVNGTFDFAALPPQVTDSARQARTLNIGFGGGGAPLSQEARDSIETERRRRARQVGWRYSQLPPDSARLVDSLITAKALLKEGAPTDTLFTRRQREVRDSVAGAVRRAARTAVRERSCRETGFYTRTQTRFEGELAYAVRVPCDSMALLTSKELPASAYDPNEQVFSMKDAEQLASALDLSLVPAWYPQRPTYEVGTNRVRYNRVEALSWGPSVRMQLGKGYTARAEARIGVGDWSPNAELGLDRSNGRTTIGGTVYRRLRAMNEFGDPLTFGAGLGAFLYGRDEGLYFRVWGAEGSWTRTTNAGPVGVRVFAERHDAARAQTNFSVFGNLANSVALRDLPVREGEWGGVATSWRTSRGLDPAGWQLLSDVRTEAAAGTQAYARGLVELTVSKRLARWLGLAVTGSTGTATDSVPVQRAFTVGGLRTVRGQLSGTNIGDSYWFARNELTWSPGAAVRPSVFYDIGWAGRRADYASPGRPMSGFGAGLSILDGALRFDLSRGIHPLRITRLDVSLEARF